MHKNHQHIVLVRIEDQAATKTVATSDRSGVCLWRLVTRPAPSKDWP